MEKGTRYCAVIDAHYTVLKVEEEDTNIEKPKEANTMSNLRMRYHVSAF